jgi:hypothetical protein
MISGLKPTQQMKNRFDSIISRLSAKIKVDEHIIKADVEAATKQTIAPAGSNLYYFAVAVFEQFKPDTRLGTMGDNATVNFTIHGDDFDCDCIVEYSPVVIFDSNIIVVRGKDKYLHVTYRKK